CAIFSIRSGSYSTGLTSTRFRAPMFFMARTEAAMFTMSCGSKRTTRTCSSACCSGLSTPGKSGDSGRSATYLHGDGPVGGLPVAGQRGVFTVRSGYHQLPGPALPVPRPLVHEHVEHHNWR